MLRFLTALLLLAATTLSPAQNLEDHDYKLNVDVELVQLPVSVHDKKGLPVRGLRQEHFAIYEDKVQQDISVFKQEDVPLSIALVIDTSGSMSDKLDRLNTAAMTFVQESNSEDETSIVSFGDDVSLEQDFTSNTRKLKHALAGITASGNTSLYDAVLLGAKHLEEDGFREKKVLLVVSDGEDNHSKYKLKDVLETVKESKVIVYTVGLLGPDAGILDGGFFAGKAKKALKQFAEVTGGASFFPQNLNDVEEVCRKIARDLRNQYTIGYRPSNGKQDGSWRRVIVQVSPPKTTSKLQVRTKQGYYAPVPRGPRG